jgi:hypothetical protein
MRTVKPTGIISSINTETRASATEFCDAPNSDNMKNTFLKLYKIVEPLKLPKSCQSTLLKAADSRQLTLNLLAPTTVGARINT